MSEESGLHAPGQVDHASDFFQRGRAVEHPAQAVIRQRLEPFAHRHIPNVTRGRALRELQKMNQRFPGKYITRVFYTAKGPEIIQIFSKANMQEKAEVIRIMSEVDPSNASDYEKINEEK